LILSIIAFSLFYQSLTIHFIIFLSSNSAVQIFDYKLNKSRVVFGPELVMLDPDEEFTIVSLSAGIPKQPNQIKSLCLSLGPDFMKDSVVVEVGLIFLFFGVLRRF
jgi:hypothetical protein